MASGRSRLKQMHGGLREVPPEPSGNGRPRATPSIRLTSLVKSWLPPARLRALLSTLRVFSGCTRRQIYRVARWGDVIETEPGEVFMREDHTDYWFFVVLAGRLDVTRDGKKIAVLTPGDHYGEVAIVGFRPQSATVTVVEPTVLFVLGRRYLLSLAAMDTSIQRALFPDVAPGTYSAFVRELHAAGLADWERLGRRRERERFIAQARIRPPGRQLSWSEAVHLLLHDESVLEEETEEQKAARAPQALSKRRKLAIAAMTLVAAVAFSLVYHPPVAVVIPGKPVDVSEDISISGAKVHWPSGRYLLTTVRVERPTLAGAVFDRIAGRTIVRTSSSEAEELDPRAMRDRAHHAFLRSHKQAIAVAEKAANIDPTGVTIAIRDRGVLGPSGGLIYALAIVDMLDPADLSNGRVIAGTGELLPDGKIGGVGFIRLKARAARDGGAVLFFVPWQQALEVGKPDIAVEGVTTLADAVKLLRKKS